MLSSSRNLSDDWHSQDENANKLLLHGADAIKRNDKYFCPIDKFIRCSDKQVLLNLTPRSRAGIGVCGSGMAPNLANQRLELVMSKGQKRSNREVKKPKQQKSEKKAAAAS